MAVFSTFRLLAAGIAAAAVLTSHVLPARELLTPAVAAYDELAPDLTEPEDTTLSEGAVTIPVPLPEEGSVTISQAAPNTPPAAHTPAVAPVTPAQAAASVKIPSGPLVTDSLFTDAYRAYRKGNLDELLRLQPQLTGHPLASYVDLWVLLLNAQANPKDQETVRQLDRFISTRQNDYVAERARADWARIAAKNDDARLFYRLYKKLEWNREEPDLVCSKARFDLKTGDRKKTAALAAARTTLRDTPLAADPACVRLRNDYLALRPKDAWPQLLVLLQQKRFQPARDIIARYSRQLPAARGTLLAVLNNPSKWRAKRPRFCCLPDCVWQGLILKRQPALPQPLRKNFRSPGLRFCGAALPMNPPWIWKTTHRAGTEKPAANRAVPPIRSAKAIFCSGRRVPLYVPATGTASEGLLKSCPRQSETPMTGSTGRPVLWKKQGSRARHSL